jgi:hypothetical protein
VYIAVLAVLISARRPSASHIPKQLNITGLDIKELSPQILWVATSCTTMRTVQLSGFTLAILAASVHGHYAQIRAGAPTYAHTLLL